MKNAILIPLLCLGISFAASAQQETLFRNGALGLTGIFGGTIHNSSYFQEEDWAYLRGGYFGLEFGRTLQVGWANYRLREDIPIAGTIDDYRMRYNGLMLGLTPDSHKLIHPKIGLIAGAGRVTFNSNDADRDNIYVVQPSLGVEVNVFTWFHLGLEGGYRMVSGVDDFAIDNSDLSTPFAQLDLRFGIFWGRKNRRNRNW